MNKTVVSIAVLIGMASSGALAKSADAFITQCKAEMIEAIYRTSTVLTGPASIILTGCR